MFYQGHLEPITNRQTWTDTFTCVDDSGNPIDITTALIEVFVREKPSPATQPWVGWDNSVSVLNTEANRIVLQGTSADGHVTKPGGGASGTFTWTFTDTEVRKLCPVTHEVAVYVTIATVVSPAMIVTIDVKDGIKP